MDFIGIDDMHLLLGWFVFIGIVFTALEWNRRRKKAE